MSDESAKERESLVGVTRFERATSSSQMSLTAPGRPEKPQKQGPDGDAGGRQVTGGDAGSGTFGGTPADIVSDTCPREDPDRGLTLEDYARLAEHDPGAWRDSFDSATDVEPEQLVALFDRLRAAESQNVDLRARVAAAVAEAHVQASRSVLGRYAVEPVLAALTPTKEAPDE